MSKFTPGPWVQKSPTASAVTSSATLRLVAMAEAPSPKERQANAALIAAAPELYDALNNIVRYEQDEEFRVHAEAHADEATGGNVSAWKAFIWAAETALAKADGKP